MSRITGIKYDRSELLDIMETISYGAIDYWADIIPTDPTEDGRHKRILIDDREAGNKGMAFTINDIQHAVDLVVSDQVQVRSDIRDCIASGDVGMIDATAADVLAQVGLFRNLVYSE